MSVSWFGDPLQLNVDLLRERSLRYLCGSVAFRGAPPSPLRYDAIAPEPEAKAE